MAEKKTDLDSLHGIIQTIRRELGISQAKLAEILRVNQTAVSQYEQGRIAPSDQVLLKLKSLASISLPENEDLQTAIITHLAHRMGAISDSSWEDYFDGESVRTLPTWPLLLNINAEFIREVRAFLIADPLKFEVSDDMVKLLRLYRENHGSHAVLNIFRRAADYIEVELKNLNRAANAKPVRTRPRTKR